MEEILNTTEESENNTTQAEESETTEEVKEEPKSQTVNDILDDKKDSSIPLSKFLEVKNEKKALEKEISRLKIQAESGATKSEITSDLKDIADKYDVDPEFLNELSTIMFSKAEKAVESKLQPLEAKEKKERIDKAFAEHYAKVIAEMPEYEDVINKDVIKELSLLPQNGSKTFQQIIEETYGKTVFGKKTMETSTPRGGKDASLDMSRVNDPEYFRQIMASPELKKKYNEGIENRINL